MPELQPILFLNFVAKDHMTINPPEEKKKQGDIKTVQFLLLSNNESQES